MSEDEGDDFGAVDDEEVSIPRASLNKFIKEVLPYARLSNDTRDLLLRCCHEFIHQIASKANSACLAANRKTISPEHVFQALDAMQLSDYKQHAQAASEEAKQELKGRRMLSAAYRFKHQNQDDFERLAREQQEIFMRARANFESEQMALGLQQQAQNNQLLAAASEHHQQLMMIQSSASSPPTSCQQPLTNHNSSTANASSSSSCQDLSSPSNLLSNTTVAMVDKCNGASSSALDHTTDDDDRIAMPPPTTIPFKQLGSIAVGGGSHNHIGDDDDDNYD